MVKRHAVTVHASWVIWWDVMAACNVKRYGITVQTWRH